MRILLAVAIAVAVPLVAAPARALDPSSWDRVLRAHARGGGFDYAGLAGDRDARADLDRFLADVEVMSEGEPLASWLNAYDAIVVHEIVRRWPIESVMRVPGFFDRERHRVAGADRTLDEIENRIVRPRFRDARVHAALVCGARSCPALQPRAFVQGELDAQLDALVRAWLASDRHLRVEGGRVHASAIFGWYRADFERDGGSVIGWIRRYAPDRLGGVPDDAALVEIPYDWGINSVR